MQQKSDRIDLFDLQGFDFEKNMIELSLYSGLKSSLSNSNFYI